MKASRWHRLALLTLPATLFGLAGCAALPGREVQAGGAYCFLNPLAHGHHGPCLDGPLPDADTAQQAWHFAPDPQALTVYVVRQNWSDGPHRVAVSLDGQPLADTLPSTTLRLRVPPGAHAFTLHAEGHPPHTISLDGRAGEVHYLHIATLAGLWHMDYGWELEPDAVLQARARRTRLVADLREDPTRPTK
ncbi:hypothetical protein ABIC63_004232 [Pseudacidovorax sp. 1753]|uniref:hypothetical protein n=1 Tax=unclassified Pseudacidovorax TaxID=2620592 RepID=UPI001B74681C|nr:hypothetical protein [Pseudacidovorax sp.]MBP6895547.1 hypothetical protein [Pseudacidovorax sp.]